MLAYGYSYSIQVASPVPGRGDSKAELDDLISRLVDRPGSASISHGADGPSRKGSRPNSLLSSSQLSGENAEVSSPTSRPQLQSIAVQTAATDPIIPASELPPAPQPKPEVVTYSKSVQTDDLKEQRSGSVDESVESEGEDVDGGRSSKRLSRRERERDEEIRNKLRQEIEDELQATNRYEDDQDDAAAQSRYPLRTLNDDELQAVTSSDDFLDFVERSAKVIERTLDEEYDVLADYELGGIDADLEDDDEHGKKRRGIKEVCQFWDERWSKKRMISDLGFSPKVCCNLRYQLAYSQVPVP